MSAGLDQPPKPIASRVAAERWAELPDSALVEHARLGDQEAMDVLLRRHLRGFRRRAQMLCDNSPDAEDICQNACLQAVALLPRLRHPEAFSQWVAGFLAREAKHWRRKMKKLGTLEPDVGTYLLEDMSVERTSCRPDCAAEEQGLLCLLEQNSFRLDAGCRAVAACLLRHYERHGELPSVRALAQSAHTSRSSAGRKSKAVLQVWRRVAVDLGLWPEPAPSKATPNHRSISTL